MDEIHGKLKLASIVPSSGNHSVLKVLKNNRAKPTFKNSYEGDARKDPHEELDERHTITKPTVIDGIGKWTCYLSPHGTINFYYASTKVTGETSIFILSF